MILHTQNGLAVSSTNFRGDNLTFTPPSPPFSPPTSLSLLSPTFSLYVFHQVSSLKSKLKKQSTATGSGVARAFMRAQAALFGSYRDALRYRPVRTQSLLTVIWYYHVRTYFLHSLVLPSQKKTKESFSFL